MFSEIAKADILVHHPYESFATSFEAFVRTAAGDPDVIALKATVYRTSDETPLVPALAEAAENGQQSVCLVELKARFDERRNIEWSQALERAGVHVVYGFPNLKIHAKATLVVRREAGGLKRYVHIGTGNYHSVTARVYEDFGLFTADPEIAQDVANLFNYVTGFGRPEQFRKLLVAPFNLRDRLIEEIRRVAESAAARKKARIRIKVNNLSDRAIIDELYLASQAGVKIDLIVRSVCALRPGVKGMTENIRVRSVLGRFLEHSRVFNFESRGEHRYFLGSADLLPRNLDHRLEAVAPVEDVRLQQRLGAALDALLEDTTAWELESDGSWKRVSRKKGDPPRSGQVTLMRAARRRRARAATPEVHHLYRTHPACRPGCGENAADERRNGGRGVEHDQVAGRRRRTASGLRERRDKRVVGLGADVERNGAVSAPKLAEACEASRLRRGARGGAAADRHRGRLAGTAGGQCRPARAPALALPGTVPSRPLSRTRGSDRFEGALAGRRPSGAVAVCDVGGGSAQLAVGTDGPGPHGCARSIFGSLRLRARVPRRPADRKRGRRPPAPRRRRLPALIPPLPEGGVAVGGTARNLKKLVGRTLGEDELNEAMRDAPPVVGRGDRPAVRRRPVASPRAAGRGRDPRRGPAAARDAVRGRPRRVARGSRDRAARPELPAVQAGGR